MNARRKTIIATMFDESMPEQSIDVQPVDQDSFGVRMKTAAMRQILFRLIATLMVQNDVS